MNRTPHHNENICGVSIEVEVALPLYCIVGPSYIHAYIFAKIIHVVVGHCSVRSGGRRHRRCCIGARRVVLKGIGRQPWLFRHHGEVGGR